MRSTLGTKESWQATEAAFRARHDALTMVDLADVAVKNAQFRDAEEDAERNMLVNAGEHAKEEMEIQRIEEEAEEEAMVDKVRVGVRVRVRVRVRVGVGVGVGVGVVFYMEHLYIVYFVSSKIMTDSLIHVLFSLLLINLRKRRIAVQRRRMWRSVN